MVPTTQNRLLELLDNVRTEFEQLTQDAIVCKNQRDEFELKSKSTSRVGNALVLTLILSFSSSVTSQVQEMGHIQQSLVDLERAQQVMKKQ
jgi:glucose repression regulatory protein TUP1